MSQRIDLLAGGLCSLALTTGALAQVIDQGIIAEGTPFETRWHSYDSEVDGPTVLVIGGVHGDERAGHRAARQIATWPVIRGRLVVVPAANPTALAERTRRIPGLEEDEGDLNRHFKVVEGKVVPSGPAAPALWTFIESIEPDVMMDLHEGYGFRAAGSKSVGTSIITQRDADDAAQALMLAAGNRGIEDPERRFVELNGIVAGSLAHGVSVEFNIEAHIIETTHKEQRLSRRCRQHRRIVAARLANLKMLEADQVVNRLIDPDDQRPKIALYDGGGAGGEAQGRLFESQLPGCRVERVGPVDIRSGCLSLFDAVIFPGGSGSAQAKAIAESGREAVTQFVDGGGGYVGVCAGAYLALDNYTWSLGLLPLNSFDTSHWRRGQASLELELSECGEAVFERLGKPLVQVEFRQGPLMRLSEDASDRAEPEVLAWFRSGVGKNGADPATMVDTPAIVCGDYGEGRVLLFSPHPEKTHGLEEWLRLAIDWLAETPTLTPLEQAVP